MSHVLSVNTSNKKGTVKKPVSSITVVPDLGVTGDAHAGPGLRQISLLAQESIDKMNLLTKLEYGSFAENITTAGINLHTLHIGDKLQIGDAVLEITQIGKECHSGCEIAKKAGACIMPKEGVFARAVISGEIKPGDKIVVI